MDVADIKPIGRRKKVLRESDVEAHLIKTFPGLALKFVSPGRNGVADRILLRPVPAHHQSIVAKYFSFAELKRPGETPRPDQLREHQRMRQMGFTVHVFDNKEQIDALQKD